MLLIIKIIILMLICVVPILIIISYIKTRKQLKRILKLREVRYDFINKLIIEQVLKNNIENQLKKGNKEDNKQKGES